MSFGPRALRTYLVRLVGNGEDRQVLRDAVSAIAAKRSASAEFPELRAVSAVLV